MWSWPFFFVNESFLLFPKGLLTITWTEFWHFFAPPPPPCVDSFYTLSVDKDGHSLTTPPPSSCPRSYWMTPDLDLKEKKKMELTRWLKTHISFSMFSILGTNLCLHYKRAMHIPWQIQFLSVYMSLGIRDITLVAWFL